MSLNKKPTFCYCPHVIQARASDTRLHPHTFIRRASLTDEHDIHQSTAQPATAVGHHAVAVPFAQEYPRPVAMEKLDSSLSPTPDHIVAIPHTVSPEHRLLDALAHGPIDTTATHEPCVAFAEMRGTVCAKNFNVRLNLYFMV